MIASQSLSTPLSVVLDKHTAQLLTHKRLPANTFVTELRRPVEHCFVCYASIPGDHLLFSESGREPRQDAFFLTETCRQASIAVCHQFLGVEHGANFVISDFRMRIYEQRVRAQHSADGERVITIRITVPVDSLVSSRRSTELTAFYQVEDADETLFTGRGKWTILPAHLYTRLRDRAAQRKELDIYLPSEAGTRPRLGRRRPENVVVTPPTPASADTERSTLQCELIVDREHTTFFDHENDHVPGLLLFEGCVQASLLSAASWLGVGSEQLMVDAAEIKFSRFAELTKPVRLLAQRTPAASPDHGMILEITAQQEDSVLCGGSFSLATTRA